ncbi:MAG: hypothetical protein IJQ50_07695, partial [Clostridia bacterium]|nr:hypothetical protein [Clostridia bacterium]
KSCETTMSEIPSLENGKKIKITLEFEQKISDYICKIYLWDKKTLEPLCPPWNLNTKSNNDFSNTISRVYGVEFEHNNPDNSSCLRIGDAYGLNTNYIIDTEMAMTCENDFDSIYPWCAIRRCNINQSGVITYEDEAGFTTDGTNGDVFVEIPKFYSFREVADDKERICISGTKYDGFLPEPVFIDENGNELDYVYVGAYETSENNKSVSGEFPTVKRAMTDFMDDAKTKGFSTFDYAMFIALQKLILIEYADKDISKYFNGIGDLPYWNEIVANESVSNNNSMMVKTYQISNLKVGQWVAVSDNNSEQILADRQVTSIVKLSSTLSAVSFSGPPINITKNVTTIYATAQPTGETDTLAYHTGRFGDNTRSPFRYRWIENLWGNTWTQCAGVIIRNLEYYVTTDLNKYDGQISTWEKLSYSAPLQEDYPYKNTGYIHTEGYTEENRLFALPSSVGGNYSAYGDQYYSKSEQGTECIMTTGGGWDHSTRNGNFTSRFWYRRSGIYSGDGGVSWLVGSRLTARKNFK